MHHLTQMLQDYGFSEKEAMTYLWCLELGAAPASTIARRINEKRVTIYVNLKSLCAKGIATEAKKKKVSYFSVVQPDILMQKVERTYENFKKNLPDLVAVSNAFDNRLKTQFFEWVDGLISLYEDQLTSTTDIHSFLWTTEANEKLVSYFYDTYVPARVKKNIFAYKIMQITPSSKAFKKNDKKAFRQTVLLEDFPIGTANEIILYGPNKVGISLLTDKDLMGVIIHSEQLYTTLLTLFQYVWKKETK